MNITKNRRRILAIFVAMWGVTPVVIPAYGQDLIVNVQADRAVETAKYESQQTTIITEKEIQEKQAKSAEDIVFNETGVTRTVDAMGRVGVSIRGAEPRHTLILVDGQRVLGDFAKYTGGGDELQRQGAENLARIEIIKGAASAKYGADAIGGVVNIVTKKPLATAGIQLNAESNRIGGSQGMLPYSNVFLRADSGEMGKLKLGVYGSKRDIMPINASTGRIKTWLSNPNLVGEGTLPPNSLRFFGDASNIGISATYEMNDDHQVELKLDRYTEDLNRYVKTTDSFIEPQRNFKREVSRNTYTLSWNGRAGETDWQTEVSYSRMNENDVTTTSLFGKNTYEGKNTLNYIDNVDHRQLDLNVTANTQVNEEHLLSYGFGYNQEEGTGSRLKSAPNKKRVTIDPWDYDKSLIVYPDSYSDKTKAGKASSTVHDYEFDVDEHGVPKLLFDYEYYGYDVADSNTVKPPFTKEDSDKYLKNSFANVDRMPPEVRARYDQMKALLLEQNPGLSSYAHNYVVINYFNGIPLAGQTITLNGTSFKGNSVALDNKMTVGTASIKKQHVFIQDTWQVNENTIFSPIIRVDNSSLFGMNATVNFGVTHNLGGNIHRRLKANIGTGYAEPGLGELYYNWEMYGSSPVGVGVARLGWYFAGNPLLKPEKSVNFDIGFETEDQNTTFRTSIFHNRIKEYMTIYYTGHLIDFSPDVKGFAKYLSAPDMIYSFKNIGRAEITGLEAEVRQQFNKNWSGKLGYTFLHAINKSDPTMPRQLLDKPKHKIDIGVHYDNKETGWSGSLWGNYYFNMLDSNSLTGNGSYIEVTDNPDPSVATIDYNIEDRSQYSYKEKTFGIWNLMIQKKINKDSLVYVGVNNLFNYRDDDRALQERVYRFGVNLKVGSLGTSHKETVAESAARESMARITKRLNFIELPFDTNKEIGLEWIGDYRIRSNSHTGTIRPSAKIANTSMIGTAEQNLMDRNGHGLEQRIRVGVDARVGETMQVTLLAGAKSEGGMDTSYNTASNQGLQNQRIEVADVTKHSNTWDFSIGRLEESFGATNYWFDQSYDGARAVWTKENTQVRVGYGSFKHSTGIVESPYNHAIHATFFRSPTVSEFIGLQYSKDYGITITGEEIVPNATENINFYQQLKKANTVEEQASITKRMVDLSVQAYGDFFSKAISSTDPLKLERPTVTFKVNDEEHQIRLYSWDIPEGLMDIPYTDTTPLEGDGSAFYNKWWDAHKEPLTDLYMKAIHNEADAYGFTLPDTVNREFVENELKKDIWEKNFTKNSSSHQTYQEVGASHIVAEYFSAVVNRLPDTDDGSLLPREQLGKISGRVTAIEGTLLQRDEIPAIDKAAYVQVRHQLTDATGVTAWSLRSVGNQAHTFSAAHGNTNDSTTFRTLANVVGIGLQHAFNDKVRLSLDYGQNRSAFARYMNGHTHYEHPLGTNEFVIQGRKTGSIPQFFALRLDVGESDLQAPRSWSAYVDYKHFEHGSFFGGTGAEAVPDRYLDGIRSFTIGASYVPMKYMLLEAFYTFDAQGIGMRDTLYGPEHFKLGNYTRIQATYTF